MTLGTLDADGLHDSGTQSRLGRQQLMETPHALYAGIVAADIDHRPVAYDVVGDDEAAGPAQPQRPGQVLQIGWPVGVDEDDIEGARSRPQLRQGLPTRLDPHLHHAGQSSSGKVVAGDLGQGARRPERWCGHGHQASMFRVGSPRLVGWVDYTIEHVFGCRERCRR